MEAAGEHRLRQRAQLDSVGRGDEVDRRSHDVGSHDVAPLECVREHNRVETAQA